MGNKKILVNMETLKAALFDRFTEELVTTEIKDRDNVIIDMLTAKEVVNVVESCAIAYEE